MRHPSVMLGALALIGCASAGAPNLTPGPACAPAAPTGAVGYTAARASMLVGRYSVTLIDTSGTHPVRMTAWPSVTLRLADSAERAAAAVGAAGHVARTDLQLVSGRPVSRDGAIEVDAGVLYFGCRDCVAAEREMLVIGAVAPGAFWGTWTSDLGAGPGTRARQPAGSFCALREGPGA
jgi:hypothetical protein